MGKEKFKKAEKSENIFFSLITTFRTEKIHRELILVLCTTSQFQKHNKIIWKSGFAFKTCHLNKCTTYVQKNKTRVLTEISGGGNLKTHIKVHNGQKDKRCEETHKYNS